MMRKPQLIAAALVLCASASAAHAHSDPDVTTPADGAIVETVEAIEIRFDDPIRVTAISLTGVDGDLDIERETGLDPVTEFRALPAVRLTAGAYSVEWRGLSADGHPMQGTFDFTVAD